MKKVVITGGPATGKTSLIKALQLKGFAIFPEVAREVIKQQLSLNTKKVPWDDVTGFSKLVLKDQIAHFNQSGNTFTFFDRGIPDIIGYMNFGKQTLFDDLTKSAQSNKYDFVFLLPPWKEIYETDNERREEFESAELLFDELKKAYQDSGYNPVVVPKDTVEKRIEFILNNINE